MAQIPATVSELESAASTHRAAASALSGAAAHLLQFYAIECAMKAKYLRDNRHPDTRDLRSAFGSSGHNLEHGLKSFRVPASTLPSPAPQLALSDGTKAHLQQAHQVWRYGIAHTGTSDLVAWLHQVDTWLRSLP